MAPDTCKICRMDQRIVILRKEFFVKFSLSREKRTWNLIRRHDDAILSDTKKKRERRRRYKNLFQLLTLIRNFPSVTSFEL